MAQTAEKPIVESLTVPLLEAGRMLGAGTWLTYELVRRGEFPVPIIRLGGKIRVPRAPLERLLGIDVDEEARGP